MGSGVAEQVEKNQKPKKQNGVAKNRGVSQDAVEEMEIIEEAASGTVVIDFKVSALDFSIFEMFYCSAIFRVCWRREIEDGGDRDGLGWRGGEGEEEKEAD